MMLYRHSIAVTGDYPFPTDMLRFDDCYPQTNNDAAAIERSMRPGQFGQVTLRVEKLTEKLDARWTPKRWESFGWSIVKGSSRTDKLCVPIDATKKGRSDGS